MTALPTGNKSVSTMKAWHFVGDTLRDGRPVPADGEWLEHEGDLILCKVGLHASPCPFDAMMYAPGNTLCRVELDGVSDDRDTDKVVASKRKILWRIDAESIVREAARLYALEVVDLWDAPKVVLDFLKTGDESLRGAAQTATAWAAARASRDASRDAARAAARDAACGAAWGVVWHAARGARGADAWAAARHASRDAARAAARAKQRTILRNLIARQLREER